MVSLKKLVKKVKVKGVGERSKQIQEESLLRGYDVDMSASGAATTPTGFFAIYVGEERERFVVPTGYLSHPLFKMLLEKSYDEFGFEQKISRLVVPCSVSAFQEIVNAVEGSSKKFEFGKLVEEFIEAN